MWPSFTLVIMKLLHFLRMFLTQFHEEVSVAELLFGFDLLVITLSMRNDNHVLKVVFSSDSVTMYFVNSFVISLTIEKDFRVFYLVSYMQCLFFRWSNALLPP